MNEKRITVSIINTVIWLASALIGFSLLDENTSGGGCGAGLVVLAGGLILITYLIWLIGIILFMAISTPSNKLNVLLLIGSIGSLISSFLFGRIWGLTTIPYLAFLLEGFYLEKK